MKNRKIFIVLNITIFLFIIYFGISFVKSDVINSKIDDMIEEFKQNAVLNEKISTDKIKYYKVSNETKENRPSFYDDNYSIPGNRGDILVELDSPFYIPVVKELQTHFAGGHALFTYGEKILEVTGNIFKADNKVQYLENDYITNDGLSNFVGLRVKNMTEQDYIDLDSYLQEQIGKKYNYLYFIDRKNKFYCTDLVSRAYESLNKGYNLNPTGGFVTVQDLVISDDTYIFMLKEKNKDNGFNIYYLE